MPKQRDSEDSYEDRHAIIEDMIPVAAPTETTRSRLTLRMWRFPEVTNSFVAGSLEAGGLSERFPSVIPYEVETTTLARLRLPIEGVDKRTSLFQELLAVMCALPNPHRWPCAKQLTYRFGVWGENPDEAPTIIQNEEDLVSKWITRPLEQDLILIPQAQIDDRDVCTLVSASEVAEEDDDDRWSPGAPRRSPRCP